MKGTKIVKYTNGTYLKAPYDLVITSYNVSDSKEKVRSNNYVSYISLSSLKMELSIDEEDINKVSINQNVTITLNYDETREAIMTTGISNIAYVEVKSGLNGNEILSMISVDNTTSNKPFNKGERNFNFNDMERPDINYKTNDSTGGINSR